MAVLLFAKPALLICFVVCVFPLTVHGNVMRLFTNNPPDFVNIQNLKSSVQELVNKVGNRLRCDDHGLQKDECVKCLNPDDIIRVLKLDPLSKSISKQNAEDLAVFFTHQILYFESMCVSLSPGCVNYQECQEEVLEVVDRYSSPRESLVKILRIFKMYLKEEQGKQCLDADQILSELPSSHSHDVNTMVKNTRRMFAVVMGYLFQGYCINSGESVTDFIDDIFHHYGEDCSPYITVEGLKRIMHDLQSGQGDDHDHDHHHSHHHDNEHEHNHDCEHTHGEYSHYHSHSGHSHDGHDHDTHTRHLHNDSMEHFNHHHSHHNHDDHLHHDHDNMHHIEHNHLNHDATLPPSDIQQKLNDSVTEVSVTISLVNNNLTDSTLYSLSSTEEAKSTDTTTTNSSEASVENATSTPVHRNKRSDTTERPVVESEDLNEPARSLKSDFSLPEDRHHIEFNRHSDDVKKVYLLESEEYNRNVELSGTPHQFASLATKCLSVEELFQKFGYQPNGSLSKDGFYEICPALIQQIVSGVCTNPVLPPAIMPSKMEVYGYGSLAVFIISLSSLVGVLLLPFMGKKVYSYIIAGFCGLAFSTLTADALLHLIPQFLGLHTHGPGGEHGHSHEDVVLELYAQLMLGVFVTVYALFLFESIMAAFSGSDHHSSENKGHGHSHSHLPDELPTLMSVKTKSETQLAVSRDQSNSSLDTEIVEVETIKKPPNLMVNKPIFLGLTSFAIVVTIGDSIHNFGDGLAIGAAFSTGVRGGLSTAIAVLFHELPHEFGDFVVLLSTGLSFSKALWINFLSSLTCFAGLYIGILIGDNEDARKWVMVVTAGTFLYVALGEMLPDLREHHSGSKIKMLLVKNLGILAGIVLMFLISVYESKLV